MKTLRPAIALSSALALLLLAGCPLFDRPKPAGPAAGAASTQKSSEPSGPQPGIQWCHDYSIYRATGRVPDKSGSSIGDLRGRLGGYRPVEVTNRPPQEVQASLRPGDVVTFGGGAHSGYVETNGSISHFLQPNPRPGAVKPVFGPGEIEHQPTLLNQTYTEVLNTTYPNRPPRAQQPYAGRTTTVYQNPNIPRDRTREVVTGNVRDNVRSATRRPPVTPPKPEVKPEKPKPKPEHPDGHHH